MKGLNIKCLIGLLIFITYSCNKYKHEPFELPENAMVHLTGGTSKTWKLAKRLNNDIRMNMGDCFLSYRITYHHDNNLNDNNDQFSDCGDKLNASWKFIEDEKGFSFIKIESDQLPSLMHIKENYKYFQLLDLSEETLTLTYQHSQFSDKAMWITDYYVPESVKVEDRNFHNK